MKKTTVMAVAVAIGLAAALPCEATLLSYWGFDDTTDNLKADGPVAQLNGDAQYSTAQVKGGTHSLLLDGVSDYAFVNAANGKAQIQDVIRNRFTVAMWARSDVPSSAVNNNGLAYMFDIGSSHGNGAGVFFNQSHGVSANDRIGAYYNSPGISSDVEGNADQWYHVALTGDGTTVRLYVDGVEKGSRSQSMSLSTGQDFRIGAEAKSSNREWEGYIDEVSVWTQPLDATKVGQLMAGTLSLNALPSWDFQFDAFVGGEEGGPGAVGPWKNDGRWRYMSTTVAAGSPMTAPGDFLDLTTYSGTDWIRSGGYPSCRVGTGGTDGYTLHTEDNEFPALAWEANFDGDVEYYFDAERYRSATSAQYQLLHWDASGTTMNVLTPRTFLNMGSNLMEGTLTVGTGDILYLVIDDNNNGQDNDRVQVNATIQTIPVNLVPEPMTMLAVGLSVAGLGGYVRKRRRA